MTTAYGSPSEYPQGDFFAPKDHIGSLLLVKVRSIEDVATNNYGVRPAARCDIDVLDGPGAGAHFPDTLLFNVALLRLCRARLESVGPGGMILGRLGIGDSKSGKTPIVFMDASPNDMQIADAFLKVNSFQNAQPAARPSTQSFAPPAGYPSPPPPPQQGYPAAPVVPSGQQPTYQAPYGQPDEPPF